MRKMTEITNLALKDRDKMVEYITKEKLQLRDELKAIRRSQD